MHVTPLQAMPVAIAAFAASLVEFVEALTVVLAVGATRGWRSALAGSGAAAIALAALVLMLGPLLALLPVEAMKVAIGLLLLLFGLRWLRKAVLRSAGVIPLHDEAAAFVRASQSLGASGSRSGWDAAGLATAFQITLLEGIEVVFIVVAIGAGRRDLLATASLGAAVALVAVVGLGLLLHRPLARVPENALKFVVGALLCAFGTFWIGEGAGLPWPGADWSLLGMGAGFILAGLLAARWCRAGAGAKVLSSGGRSMTAIIKRAAGELFGLFVDDGGLAAFAVAWVLAVALGLPRVVGAQGWVAPLLFAGLAALLVGSAVRRARRVPP